MSETTPSVPESVRSGLDHGPAGRATTTYHDVPCALACGRSGTAAHFVRDLRMPGILVRVEVDDLPWFVCEPCITRLGAPVGCLRCGCETHVAVGPAMRCVRCGELA